jgi:hypothetical protein
MWNDPIVQEVRAAGAKLARQCGYNFHRYSLMIKEHQKKNGKILVAKKDIKDIKEKRVAVVNG